MTESAKIQIVPANSSDYKAVTTLLSEVNLPLDGLSDHVDSMLVACDGSLTVGSVAIEDYLSFGLLRSLAVLPDHQAQGLGARLVQAALELARQRGIIHLYLLTETAGDYFPRFGFQRVNRAVVPAVVQKSVEFTQACPETAIAMCLEL